MNAFQIIKNIPESPVFSTRYKVQEVKNNSCHINPLLWDSGIF